jgi:archaetidylinositol phosphate synthase
MKNNTTHERVNDIFLAPLERPTLQWLVVHMPSWINPDILTIVGMLGTVVIFCGYCLSNKNPGFLWVASLGFVINWLGDSLDGNLARYRKIERPKYGFFVDRTVDSFGEVLIALGLGLSPYVSFNIACLGLIGYLLMTILVCIRTYVSGVFQLSYGKLGPTEVRVILILLNTTMYFWGIPEIRLPLGLNTIYDIPIAILAVVLSILYIFGSLSEAIALAKLEEE